VLGSVVFIGADLLGVAAGSNGRRSRSRATGATKRPSGTQRHEEANGALMTIDRPDSAAADLGFIHGTGDGIEPA